MKIYEAKFKGLYVGGYAIVVAESPSFAQKLVSIQAQQEELPNLLPENIQITEINMTKSGVKSFYNGDY